MEETLGRAKIAEMRADAAAARDEGNALGAANGVKQDPRDRGVGGVVDESTPWLTRWLPPLLRDTTRFNVVLLYAALSVQGIGFDEMCVNE